MQGRNGPCVLRRRTGWVTMRQFTASKFHGDGANVRLDFAGDIRGDASSQLATMVLEALFVDLADELQVDLGAAGYLDRAGVAALVSGYVAAVESGAIYRVVNARGQVQRTLRAKGLLDMLADSQDLGALLLALLTMPPPAELGR